jgi:lipopolysaccharide transport system ATP-binding protein
MSSEYAIEVSNLGKCYEIYQKPSDRLKQTLFRGRRKYYKEFWALKDVSFKIKKGETFAIIGRNGSGKSTLLQMICGTLNPTVGDIKVNGRVAALLELGAGFNPEFSGVDNVYMAASLYGLSREEVDGRFDEIATFADIGEHIYQPVKTYSSGMYVRLAFAVIAHVDADILVIDEALAVGDVFFQQKCMRFLREFHEKGGSILLVTHDTGAVLSICTRAILLFSTRKGEPIISGVEEVCRYYLEDSYQRLSQDLKVLDKTQIEKNNNRDEILTSYYGKLEQPAYYTVSPFYADAKSFGQGKGKIIDAGFFTEQGEPLFNIHAEQSVVFKITARITEKVFSPAFGFMLKNKYGEYLFTEGTDKPFRSYNLVFDEGQVAVASFKFNMPSLIKDPYSINVAFAEGIGDDHQQLHWIHDAIVIESLSSRLVHGYCGVHNLESTIELKKDGETNE